MVIIVFRWKVIKIPLNLACVADNLANSHGIEIRISFVHLFHIVGVHGIIIAYSRVAPTLIKWTKVMSVEYVA